MCTVTIICYDRDSVSCLHLIGHPVPKVYTYDEWTMRLGKLHASIGLQRLGFCDGTGECGLGGHPQVEVYDIWYSRIAVDMG